MLSLFSNLISSEDRTTNAASRVCQGECMKTCNRGRNWFVYTPEQVANAFGLCKSDNLPMLTEMWRVEDYIKNLFENLPPTLPRDPYGAWAGYHELVIHRHGYCPGVIHQFLARNQEKIRDIG